MLNGGARARKNSSAVSSGTNDYIHSNNIMKSKIILFYLFSIVLFSVVGVYYSSLEYFSDEQVCIVVSRYMENLDWLNDDKFRDYKTIIYNKGSNEDFYKPPNSLVINIPNYGRETHSYLFHIIHNYDNLADITVFLPGSTDSENKYNRTKDLIAKIKDANTSCYSCMFQSADKMKELYNFSMEDKYKCTNAANKQTCIDDIQKSDIRPFGKWYEKNIGNNKNDCIAYNSIFSVAKEDIRQFPVEYYKKLFEEVDKKENPETGHYFERSWLGVFNPKNPVIIPI